MKRKQARKKRKKKRTVEDVIELIMKEGEERFNAMSKEERRKVLEATPEVSTLQEAQDAVRNWFRSQPENIAYEELDISEKEWNKMLEDYYKRLSKTEEGRETIGERCIIDLTERMDSVIEEVGSIIQDYSTAPLTEKQREIMTETIKEWFTNLKEGSGKSLEVFEAFESLSEKELEALGKGTKEFRELIEKRQIQKKTKDQIYISLFHG